MMKRSVEHRIRPRLNVWAIGFSLALLGALASAVPAATTGKIQGKIVATDTGDPIGFADVSLIPADSTMHRVGGLTNADGSFLLEAAPGKYTLQIRALSYAIKRIEGVVVDEGKLLPFNTALTPEAIQQEEIVVEGKARQNTEASMLAARKKAAAVGDAVSAEQVRKSPDKDAAEVLKRVTGLSVSDGKFVFVRGLGERYSSTDVDGVRIASPEQNKRVVPLDLLPANLLENIVVQKTYTADRPGEFGGGDVQVHTKDFPGSRTWSFAVSQGSTEGVTFRNRRSYPGGRSDFFGFGADSRALPSSVPADGSLDDGNRSMTLSQRAEIARSFRDVWSPTAARTAPNAGYSATYGDEVKLFGHPLGMIQSWNFTRSFSRRRETQRGFRSAEADSLYEYDVDRSTASAQLGGISGLSYRISPRHSVHLRGLYTNSADDEVRVNEGINYPRDEGRQTGVGFIGHRYLRLMYVQRSVLSGTVEGQHELPMFFGTHVDWKLTRSSAKRLQPDRREVTYDHRYYFEGDTSHWVIGSQAQREFGDLRDNGWGGTFSASVPYRLGGLGNGKIVLGYDRQTKKRDNLYRRFNFIPTSDYTQWELPPDSLFGPSNMNGSSGSGSIVETTYNNARYTDNYRASQRINAGFLSFDVPFGRSIRGSFGVRVEDGHQDVQSFDFTAPSTVLQEGKLNNVDWLPSANVTCAMTSAINLRLAASRTLSRPDLNELSPSPSIEYDGGSLVLGNPNLKRAVIDNYDVRVEAFPSLSEVLAAGFFYKRLLHPIEQVIKGADAQLIFPRNSDDGHNLGVELEARSSLGRIWNRLAPFSVNANGSIISSEVVLHELSHNGSERHPLQGQASYLLNAALGYAYDAGRIEATVLVSSTGKRLKNLGFAPLPDIYEQPLTTLDATIGFSPFEHSRVKVSARNLTDPKLRELQGSHEVSVYRLRRSYSIALTYGL